MLRVCPLGLALLFAAGVGCTPAEAETIDFSFTNTIGGVNGTVTVEIDGLTEGATGAATSVILLSYPSALDPEIASEGPNLTHWTFQDVNTFTVSASGVLLSEDFDVATFNPEGSVDVFTIDSITPPLAPEPPTPSPIDILGFGAYTGGLGPAPYLNAVATVPGSVPEPAALELSISSMAFLACVACFSRRRRLPNSLPE